MNTRSLILTATVACVMLKAGIGVAQGGYHLSWRTVDPDGCTVSIVIAISALRFTTSPGPQLAPLPTAPASTTSLDSLCRHFVVTPVVSCWGNTDRCASTCPAEAPTNGLEGRPRDAHPDLGAYERSDGAPTAWLYLPLVVRR